VRSDTIATPPDLRFATHAMATRFEIVLDVEPSREMQSIGEAVIAEIERLHTLLSRFDPRSLVSHINRSAYARPVRVDAATFQLLSDAHAVWRDSAGAFDPTCGTGMDGVVLDPVSHSVTFTHEHTSLDLGGIAKGHAVQIVADMLREFGAGRAFVHGGTSSVAAVGTPRDEPRGWAVTIAPNHARTFYLEDSALSASSSALREHIIDPAGRAFAEPVRIAVVTGPCARLADAWSTALVVARTRPPKLGAEWSTYIE
jgi:thiamine biosynthesis lipoprotein